MRDDHVLSDAINVDGVFVDLVSGFEENLGRVVFLLSHVLGGEAMEEFLWHHTATINNSLKEFGLWNC